MDGNPNDVAQNRVDHGSLHENSGPSDELCTEILAAPHDEGSTPAQRISDGMQMNRPKETFAGSLSIVTYTQRDQPQEGAHSRTGSQELRTQQNIPEPASAIHSHEYDEFYKAIEQSNLHLIYQFLENDIDLEQANSTGSRPLHLAAGLGHLEVVELFLQAGADVESFDETSEVRSTVLQQAVYRNDMQIAEILLQHGADVNLVDSSGETVLLTAIKNHFPEMVELLLRYGANKEVTDQSGATAFALAQQSETMAFLLQQPQLLQGPIPAHLREPRERSSLIKRVRQVRGDNDKMIALQGFEATVVDFSIGEDSENRIERSISVYELLYGSQEVIETPQTSQLKGKQRAFRWYHLPANNIEWVEDLIRHRVLKSKKLSKDFKSAAGLTTNQDRCHLATKGPPTHMRPTSFSFNISPSGEEVEYSQVAAFVPYLHFERQSNLVELSSTIADVVNRTTKSSEKAATTPGDAIKLPAMDAKTLHKHLIRGYSTVTLSRRAGLDQYFYTHLGKRSRDKNQVVCRYQLHDPVSFVVDQLWIWIIDQDTIISCMPTSVEDTSMPTKLPVEGGDLIRPKSSRSHGGRARSRRGRLRLKGWLRGEHVKSKHDTSKIDHQPFSVQHSIFQYLRRMARPQIRSPYELASLITNHCANVFAEHDIPAEYQLLDIFERSNSKASDRVNHLLKSFQTSAVAGFDDVETQLSIQEETELFVELEDIQDELVILRAVLKDQESVTEELGKILDPLGLDRNQRPKVYDGDFLSVKGNRALTSHLELIDSMERMAKKTAERLRSLLDFKQKQANIALALTSINYTEQRAVQDEESTRQSRTLTLFTVVTIVFLPLSFLAAFFAIEIDVFPVDSNGKLNLDYVLKYLLGISAGFSVPFILIAFNLDRFTSWIASIRRHLPSVYWLMVVLGFLAILLPVVWTSPLGFTAKVGATVFVVLFSFFGIISVGIWRLGKVSTQK